MPNGRCRFHGGKSLTGLAAPALVHGRYSKHVPIRLAAKYEEGIRDADLLAMRHELALLDARLADQLEQASAGESGQLWSELKKAWTVYQRAKDEDQADALLQVGWLISEGYQDYLAWEDIRATIEQRRKVMDSERGRIKDAQEMLTVENAQMLVAALVDSVRRNVRDSNVLAAISADLARLVPATSRAAA